MTYRRIVPAVVVPVGARAWGIAAGFDLLETEPAAAILVDLPRGPRRCCRMVWPFSREELGHAWESRWSSLKVENRDMLEWLVVVGDDGVDAVIYRYVVV